MNKLTAEELLFNDEPITINRKLAKCIGLTEATIFQQIHYWLKINEKKKQNFKEGKYWTFNSIREWHQNEFDFLSEGTVKRILQKLEKIGLLETNTFNKMKGDKTKWYTINYDKLIKVCEIELEKKAKLSVVRRSNGKLGAEIKKDKTKKVIKANCSYAPSKKLTPTIEETCSYHKNKLLKPIPKTTTKTSTEITTCSSSKGKQGIFKTFEDEICELKKTTFSKFKEIVNQYGEEFVIAVIEECTYTSVKSYKGFEVALNNYVNAKCSTGEEVHKYAKEFSASKRKPKNNNKVNKEVQAKKVTPKKELGFKNFDERETTEEDYRFLEVKLGTVDIKSIKRELLNIYKNDYDEYIKENNL